MIYLGDNELLGVKLGNDDIAGIYVGDNLIFPTTVTAWSVSPAVIEAESGNSTERIKIAALASWTISSNKSWITFSQNSGDSGRTTVIATIAENDTMDRTATITIAGGDGYSTTISVSQEAAPYEIQYFTVEPLESGDLDIGKIWAGYVQMGFTGLGASYSLNEGAWTAIPDTGTTLQNLSVGDRVRLKMQNWAGVGSGILNYSYQGGPYGISFNAYGNVMSLLYGDNFVGQTTFPTNYLVDSPGVGSLEATFYDSNVVDASNLILPATTLIKKCYDYMFLNCPNLTGAPELPAETLADYSYRGMFKGCSSLNYIKCLATDISATDCTNYWVEDVASAGTFVKSASMSGWTTGDNGIPTGWEVEDDTIPYDQQYLTFEILSAGTIVWKAYQATSRTIDYCLNDGAWSSITSTSEGITISVSVGDKIKLRGVNTNYGDRTNSHNTLSGSTAYFNAYGNIMSLLYGDNFSGQTSTVARYTFYGLFMNTNIIDAGNMILPATTLASNCYDGMFRNCTSLTAAPELPATTLAYYCYVNMFNNCPNLNYIKCLATDISAAGCTSRWVNNVSSTGTFVKAASMSGWSIGRDGIPNGWTVEDAT